MAPTLPPTRLLRARAPRSIRALLAGLLLAAGGLTAACAREELRPRNVLLVSIDTLRADHLGCYGYGRDTSPRIDALAERSLCYARVVAPAPWTLPSHAAMLTGRHPLAIGVTEQASRLPDDVPTLAERLAAEGFATAAFVDSSPKGFVGAKRGFERGFATYAHAPFARGALYRYDAEATVAAGLRWLEERGGEPFFLFLHTKSVHTAPADRKLLAESDVPYHKPPQVRGRFLEEGRERFSWTDPEGGAGVAWLKAANQRMDAGELDPAAFPPERLAELVALYDAGIWYTDRALGRLLDGLERLGLADDTLVVVTADHGEAFLEQGSFLHRDVYGAVLRVPLVLHDPTLPPQRGVGVVEPAVSLVDVAPTILARLGLAADGLDGLPLPLAGEPAPERELLSSTAGGLSRAAALEQDGWKLVLERRDEGFATRLFRPALDPLDLHPLDDPTRERALADRLRTRLEAARSTGEELELDEESLEELRKLGYGD